MAEFFFGALNVSELKASRRLLLHSIIIGPYINRCGLKLASDVDGRAEFVELSLIETPQRNCMSELCSFIFYCVYC